MRFFSADRSSFSAPSATAKASTCVEDSDPVGSGRCEVRAISAADGVEIRGGLPTRDELLAARHPRTAALVAAVAALGCPVDWPKQPTHTDLALGDQDPAAIAPRVAEAIRAMARPGLGWHIDTIRGSAKTRPADPRAPAAPSTDWSDKRAPWEIPS